MSLGEVEKLLNSDEGYRFRGEYASDALKSRRMDLIILCRENQYTGGLIRDGVVALPDSLYKDQLVVLMLKSPKIWPKAEYKWYWNRFPGGLMREPFVSVIKKHFPDLPLPESLLDTREARLKLASDLEKSIAKNSVKTNP